MSLGEETAQPRARRKTAIKAPAGLSHSKQAPPLSLFLPASSFCPRIVSVAFLWACSKLHSPGINCKAQYSYNCRVSIFVQITSLTSFVI